MTVFRHLPNVITLLRLVAAPVSVWLILAGALAPAFWLFVVAAGTDAVDGALARLTGTQSALGSYLDALADKVLLVGIYLSLGGRGQLDGWLVCLVVGRDFLLVAFAAALHFRRVQKKIVPLLISKVNTFAQIVLAAFLLGHHGLGWFSESLLAPFEGIVAVSTLASALAYLIAWWPRLRRWGE